MYVYILCTFIHRRIRERSEGRWKALRRHSTHLIHRQTIPPTPPELNSPSAGTDLHAQVSSTRLSSLPFAWKQRTPRRSSLPQAPYNPPPATSAGTTTTNTIPSRVPLSSVRSSFPTPFHRRSASSYPTLSTAPCLPQALSRSSGDTGRISRVSDELSTPPSTTYSRRR